MVAHITEDLITDLETVEEIPLLGEAFLNSTCLQNTEECGISFHLRPNNCSGLKQHMFIIS